MLFEIARRDITTRLAENCSQRSTIQLTVLRNDEGLIFTLRASTFQFRVASLLADQNESETGENVNEFRAG